MASGKDVHREQILVVDDDMAICQLLATALRMEGYEPILCTDSGSALDASTKEAFGLAFVDIILPDMTGLELAARLKKLVPELEVVFITGSDIIENAVQAIKLGAYDYLRKPFGLSEFILCLKRYQERTALREAVRHSEQRYTDLVQNIPLLIYVLRKDLELDFVNDACLPILGYSPREAVNTPGWFLDRIHPEDRRRMERLIRGAFASGGTAFSAECRLTHRRGHPVHTFIKSISSSGCSAGSREECMEGIILDITERVFMEKALVQKEKLKTLGAIAAEVAHEIRNPLVSIGGFARRLESKYPDLTEVRIILSESKRLEKLLNRIRNYLKPVDISWQEHVLNPIIWYCIDLLRPEIEAKGISCNLDLDPSQPKFRGDRDVLGQVFINLIRNALEAMQQGQVLSIRSYTNDRNLYIDFRNPTGKGHIKTQESLFTPFGEGGETIGLPLCYLLIKNMGGLLALAQEENHIVFTVSLPMASE